MIDEQLKIIIGLNVDSVIEGLFSEMHVFAETKSGDISPDQQSELNRIKLELSELIYQQVKQNL